MFRLFWLVQSLRLILENASNISWILWCICLETRFIDGIFACKRGCLSKTIDQSRFQVRPPSCLFTSRLKKIAFTAIRRRNKWAATWLPEFKSFYAYRAATHLTLHLLSIFQSRVWLIVVGRGYKSWVLGVGVGNDGSQGCEMYDL